MQWFNCNEKMPEIGKRVFVTDNKHFFIASYQVSDEGRHYWLLDSPRNFEYIIPIIVSWKELEVIK